MARTRGRKCHDIYLAKSRGLQMDNYVYVFIVRIAFAVY